MMDHSAFLQDGQRQYGEDAANHPRTNTRKSCKRDFKERLERACQCFGVSAEDARLAVKGSRKVTYVVDWGVIDNIACIRREKEGPLLLPNRYKVVFEASSSVWLAETSYMVTEGQSELDTPMYCVYPIGVDGHRIEPGSGPHDNISAAFRKALSMNHDSGDSKEHRPNGRLYLGIFYQDVQSLLRDKLIKEPHRVSPEMQFVIKEWLEGRTLDPAIISQRSSTISSDPSHSGNHSPSPSRPDSPKQEKVGLNKINSNRSSSPVPLHSRKSSLGHQSNSSYGSIPQQNGYDMSQNDHVKDEMITGYDSSYQTEQASSLSLGGYGVQQSSEPPHYGHGSHQNIPMMNPQGYRSSSQMQQSVKIEPNLTLEIPDPYRQNDLYGGSKRDSYSTASTGLRGESSAPAPPLGSRVGSLGTISSSQIEWEEPPPSMDQHNTSTPDETLSYFTSPSSPHSDSGTRKRSLVEGNQATLKFTTIGEDDKGEDLQNIEESLTTLLKKIKESKIEDGNPDSASNIMSPASDNNRATLRMLSTLKEIRKELISRSSIKRRRTYSSDNDEEAGVKEGDREDRGDPIPPAGATAPAFGNLGQSTQQIQGRFGNTPTVTAFLPTGQIPEFDEFMENNWSLSGNAFGMTAFGDGLNGQGGGFLDLQDFSYERPPIIVGCHLTHEGLFFTLAPPRSEGSVTGFSEEELATAMTSLRIPAASGIARATLQAADVDKNGYVNMEEFLQFLRKREEELRVMFETIDTDQDGYITLRDLKEARENGTLERNASDEELKALLEWMDTLENAYEDGKIHFEEFRTGLILLPPSTTINDLLRHFRELGETPRANYKHHASPLSLQQHRF